MLEQQTADRQRAGCNPGAAKADGQRAAAWQPCREEALTAVGGCKGGGKRQANARRRVVRV